MLVIRRTQMQAFEAVQRETFETDLRLHVQDYFPDIFRLLGDAGVAELVASAVNKAQTFGISREQDICRFLDLVMLFGPKFNLHYDWADTLLNDPMLNDSLAKSQALHQAALDYLEQHGDPPPWYDKSMQSGV